MKVLIVKTSSMGDVVHAAPVASDIAVHVPGATIDWVVEEAFAAIPRLHPAVSQVIPIALRRWRNALLSGQTWRELRSVRARLNTTGYDVVIDCQGLLKSAWVAHWAKAKRGVRGAGRLGTRLVGLDRTSAREPMAAWLYDRTVVAPRELHAIERNRKVGAAALGYAVTDQPCFGLKAPVLTHDALLAATREPFAVLLTNASRPTKLWPDVYWATVAQALAGRGLRSLLFWGSDVERGATAVRAAAMRHAHVAPPRLGIDQIAAVLARARVVVGLDTGLTHLAAALGAPTVGIFCDYDPRLVSITGESACESLGSASGGPGADDVVAAMARVMAHVH